MKYSIQYTEKAITSTCQPSFSVVPWWTPWLHGACYINDVEISVEQNIPTTTIGDLSRTVIKHQLSVSHQVHMFSLGASPKHIQTFSTRSRCLLIKLLVISFLIDDYRLQGHSQMDIRNYIMIIVDAYQSVCSLKSVINSSECILLLRMHCRALTTYFLFFYYHSFHVLSHSKSAAGMY